MIFCLLTNLYILLDYQQQDIFLVNIVWFLFFGLWQQKGLYPLHIAAGLPGAEGPEITELLLHALADPDVKAQDADEVYEFDMVWANLKFCIYLLHHNLF